MASFVFKLCLVAVVTLIGLCAVPSVNGEECKDKLAHCERYEDYACKPPYVGFAYNNCRKRCNMCETSHCVSISCWKWTFTNGCHMVPPVPGKCCATPECPSQGMVIYPAGYKEE